MGPGLRRDDVDFPTLVPQRTKTGWRHAASTDSPRKMRWPAYCICDSTIVIRGGSDSAFNLNAGSLAMNAFGKLLTIFERER